MKRPLNHSLFWMIGCSASILFLCSSIRHELFVSNAFDLSIFDQAVYLISQGRPPISSLLGFHILGDHAAWIFYPLALLYKIYPTVHWLFGVQAIALAIGAWPTWRLSLQVGLKPSQALLMAAVYLLYPLIFNSGLVDFRPDMIAPSAILWAILSAHTAHIVGFLVSISILLGCKAVFSLTVIGLGVWLIWFEKNRLYGAIALSVGISWFVIATVWIMPTFSGGLQTMRFSGRYNFLSGSSWIDILKTFLLDPNSVLEKLFSLSTFWYLFLLSSPLLWGLSLRHLKPLVAAIPALTLNILSETSNQRNLVLHYSLPILPFLLLAVISAFAANQIWLKNQRAIALWSIVAFLALAKYGFLWTKYPKYLDTYQRMFEKSKTVKNYASRLTMIRIIAM